MIFAPKKIITIFQGSKTTILFLSVVFFFVSSAADVNAQKKFSKTYPATKNVKLELTNRTGTVTVQGWDKNEIRISAYLEAPAANIVPQSLSGTILINIVKDNQGRNEVGNVNFDIKVPYSSSVDIETKIGNLNVTSINGSFVRAHVSLEGDITLQNIATLSVLAENGIGNIFFDGDIKSGGNYRFASTRGDINLSIPFRSSFRIIATAPSTRNISLGSFTESGLTRIGDGRRVVGQVGGGSALINITNQRGRIALISR